MKEKDFAYDCSASGYTIYYKHRKVYSFKKDNPRVGKGGEIDKKVYSERAEADIDAAINGWGISIMMDKIEKIDRNWENLIDNIKRKRGRKL